MTSGFQPSAEQDPAGPDDERPPRRRDDLICSSAGRESLLYDRQADAIHVLNPTAFAVWELCDGEHTADQIADYLSTHFANATRADVGSEVRAALAVLEEKALIERNAS